MGLAALCKKAGMPAASLDVQVVAGMLPVAGMLAAGKLLAGLSRLEEGFDSAGMLPLAGMLAAGKLLAGPGKLEEGFDSAGMLPVAGILVAGTLLVDLSRLLEEGIDWTASGGCVLAGTVLAGKAVPSDFLRELALPPCLPLAPNIASCFFGMTGCHCSSSSSDASACADSV